MWRTRWNRDPSPRNSAGPVNPPDPWSTSVTFTGSGVLTIIASTRGHLHQVARFAPAFLPTRARQINLVRSAFGGVTVQIDGSVRALA